jgi:hypothetical protein
MNMPSTEILDSSDIPSEARGIVTEITNRLSLNGGSTPTSSELFWRSMGLSISLSVPSTTSAEMARAVLEKLDEPWDDDYESDGIPTAAAYEALLTRISQTHDQHEESDEEDEELADATAPIFVNPMDLSLREIASQVDDGTIVLDPDWQRGYVWKTPRKRKFVESIFMSLPIPPVLLFRDKDERLYVIDGRQRLETIYRYSLGDTDKTKSFTTFGKKEKGWGENDPMGPAAGKRFNKLPVEWQRRFQTFSIPARIFYGLSRKMLYEVFRRYNTGGDKLTSAEIRNAVYQGVPLHKAIYRLAGEAGMPVDLPADQKRVAARLRSLMKGKVQRYGIYNFVGRILAFTYMESGSVASAINDFMEAYPTSDLSIDEIVADFILTFNKTFDWYGEAAFVIEQSNGKTPFNEWAATIQMVSTHHALKMIAKGLCTEEDVKEFISNDWRTFALGQPNQTDGQLVGGLAQEKQNTTTHWGKQQVWINKLQQGCCGA